MYRDSIVRSLLQIRKHSTVYTCTTCRLNIESFWLNLRAATSRVPFGGFRWKLAMQSEIEVAHNFHYIESLIFIIIKLYSYTINSIYRMWCCVCCTLFDAYMRRRRVIPPFSFRASPSLQFSNPHIFLSLSFFHSFERAYHTIPRWGQQNAAWRLWWYRRRVLHQRFAALVEQLHSKETKKKREGGRMLHSISAI